MRKLFTEMFTENSGAGSAMRLVLVFVVVVILAMWAIVCFLRREFLPFDSSHVTMVGACLAAKVTQKFGEKGEPPPPPPPGSIT